MLPLKTPQIVIIPQFICKTWSVYIYLKKYVKNRNLKNLLLRKNHGNESVYWITLYMHAVNYLSDIRNQLNCGAEVLTKYSTTGLIKRTARMCV